MVCRLVDCVLRQVDGKEVGSDDEKVVGRRDCRDWQKERDWRLETKEDEQSDQIS
jgi:hypothetical protein